VNALVIDEPHGIPPKRATDLEAVQLHIGVRYLLLAPLYGYALRELRVGADGSHIVLLHDGLEETYLLPAFRARVRTHVREELERVNALPPAAPSILPAWSKPKPPRKRASTSKCWISSARGRRRSRSSSALPRVSF
jgi:hypothetical protein